MSFEAIIGNEKVKELLCNCIKSNNVLHSYMFMGPEGIGKYLFAKEFAKMILQIEGNMENHPDFMIIEPEDGKSIKIEQIRYLQEKIAEKPIASPKKIYIINNSDSMTKEAQNCLLKTLEEPPEYAIIILILSNENKLLMTIKSRCTKIIFRSLTDKEITEYFLLNHMDSLDSSILKVCNGSIGKAVELQGESDSYAKIDEILNHLEERDIIDIWNQSDILYNTKENIHNLLEYVNIMLADKVRNTKDIRYAKCIDIVEETKRRLTSNANLDMSIDNLLLKIWEEF